MPLRIIYIKWNVPSFPFSHLKGFWVYYLERKSNYDLKMTVVLYW